MILKAYEKKDAATIAGWIKSEDELYRWSADRFNKYPLNGEDIEANYEPQIQSGRFIPLMAVDDAGNAVGHLIIRYPNADDDSSVRFGFVIVDPSCRGKGYGKEMLLLAIRYVKEHLTATEAVLKFYKTKLSRLLSEENTKLWHLGWVALYDMYKEEVYGN